MGREYLADKDTLDEVNSKVGATEDTASSTSLFAKINSLLSTLANHVAAPEPQNWTIWMQQSAAERRPVRHYLTQYGQIPAPDIWIS